METKPEPNRPQTRTKYHSNPESSQENKEHEAKQETGKECGHDNP